MNGKVIIINEKSFPSPDKGLTFEIATYVNAGKNMKGAFVGQKVGRDQHKINSITWSRLDAVTWQAILAEADKFIMTVTFPNMATNKMQTLSMYPGNRTAIPVEFNANGIPTMYENCQLSIVDCGW